MTYFPNIRRSRTHLGLHPAYFPAFQEARKAANVQKGRDERAKNVARVEAAILAVQERRETLTYLAIATELQWTPRRLREYINTHHEVRIWKKHIVMQSAHHTD